MILIKDKAMKIISQYIVFTFYKDLSIQYLNLLSLTPFGAKGQKTRKHPVHQSIKETVIRRSYQLVIPFNCTIKVTVSSS